MNKAFELLRQKHNLFINTPQKQTVLPNRSFYTSSLSEKEYSFLTAKTNDFVVNNPKQIIDLTKLETFSSDEIVMMSVCKCNEENRGNVAYNPNSGTIDDPRLGILEKTMTCYTCNQNMLTCPGHVGHIKLNYPIVNPNYKKILAIFLNLFCPICGEPYFTFKSKTTKVHEDLEIYYQKPSKLEKISKLSLDTRLEILKKDFKKSKCKCKNGHVKGFTYFENSEKDKANKYSLYKKEIGKSGSDKQVFFVTIDEIMMFLDKIREEYFIMLGTTKKIVKGMILQNLLVMPPCSRIFGMINGEKTMNPISEQYNVIIRINNSLKKFPSEINSLYEAIEKLQELIKDSIVSKKGLIRGNIQGKRVNYCARTVLNPSNDIAHHQVKVPSVFKRSFVTLINVCNFNFRLISDLYQNGKVVFITINSDSTKKGNRVKVTSNLLKYYKTPLIGDVVEVEGCKELLFNRQPTLNKYSIMGYEAVYEDDYKTFGLHSSNTTPHNADFDGDEGSAHANISFEARAECKFVASNVENMLSSQSNRPSVGLVYNSIVSVYILTDDNTFISDDLWKNTVLYVFKRNLDEEDNFYLRLSKNKVPARSGKALFSLLLPFDFYYNRAGILIKNGILVKGQIGKSQIGPSNGSIGHYLCKKYGKKRFSQFITEGQWLLDRFIERRGFSISLKDCVPRYPFYINNMINNEVNKAQKNIMRIQESNEYKESTRKKEFEVKIESHLNIIQRVGNKISLSGIKKDNPINIMTRSGAKGSESNTAQIIGCLGQQYLEGHRPEFKLTNKTRSLVYFEPNSNEINARGFIRSSFYNGCSPSEWYFHLLCSRVGLMDTALKTATTGYMHRKLNRALENNIFMNDGTVRNTFGHVYQFQYGGGFTSEQLLSVKSSSDDNYLTFIDIKNTVEQLNSQH